MQITDILKESKKTIWDHALELSTKYLVTEYKGQEHDEVKRFYWPSLFGELLYQLYHLQYEKKRNAEFEEINIELIMLETLWETRPQRIKWFHEWLSKKPSTNKIVKILQQLYPSYRDIKLVKEELGLLQSAETLKSKIEWIKYGRKKS